MILFIDEKERAINRIESSKIDPNAANSLIRIFKPKK